MKWYIPISFFFALKKRSEMLVNKRVRGFGKLFEKIRWIGRHTMWICCIHSVFQIAIPWNQLMQRISPWPIVSILVEFIVYIGGAVGICFILEKMKHNRKKHYKRMLHKRN